MILAMDHFILTDLYIGDFDDYDKREESRYAIWGY